jgi:lipopolysaccharide biosynthesis glycosyltransferase
MNSHCFVLIASSGDTHYLERGTLTTIRSISLTNPGVPIIVLHHDLTSAQQRLFEGVMLKHVSRQGFELSAWSRISRPDIPDTCFLAVTGLEHIEEFDVAIYIDADAVVLEPLHDVFGLDTPLAARIMDDDPLAEHFDDGERLLQRESIDAEYALNNGFVRFDLRYWRANGLTAQANELFRQYGTDRFRYTDQSLLNLLAYKNTNTLLPVSRLYNFCRFPDMLRMEHSLVKNHLGWTAPRIAEGVVKVVHWTGPLKPWDSDVARLGNPSLQMCLECYQQFSDGNTLS